jgi:hypothetical protein
VQFYTRACQYHELRIGLYNLYPQIDPDTGNLKIFERIWHTDHPNLFLAVTENGMWHLSKFTGNYTDIGNHTVEIYSTLVTYTGFISALKGFLKFIGAVW